MAEDKTLRNNDKVYSPVAEETVALAKKDEIEGENLASGLPNASDLSVPARGCSPDTKATLEGLAARINNLRGAKGDAALAIKRDIDNIVNSADYAKAKTEQEKARDEEGTQLRQAAGIALTGGVAFSDISRADLGEFSPFAPGGKQKSLNLGSGLFA